MSQVVKLPERMRRRLSQIHGDYAVVFGSREGERVLADICKTAGIGKDVFVQGDPHATSYRAGMQVIANRCLNRCGQGIVDIAAQMRALGDE